MDQSINILIMVPPRGESAAEQWVASGQRAAAADLITRLRAIDPQIKLDVLAAETDDRTAFSALGVDRVTLSTPKFRFGEALATYLHEQNPEILAYFGAGSAPLMTGDLVKHVLHQAFRSESAWAFVNNLHSTDWAIFNQTQRLLSFEDRFPSDNQLGWVLANEIGYEVESAPYSAATMVDIDTPCDLLMIQKHPQLGPNLAAFLENNPQPSSDRVEEILALLKAEAKTIGLIGRSSSFVWGKLEKETRLWIRAFVEERGMVASGRLRDGLVRSLVGEMLERMGPDPFIRFLQNLTDGVLWDTRVWMAHRGEWPSKADRFAADLGRIDQVSDPALRHLTRAIWKASIPIFTGGHGVVSGNVIALLETLQ